MFDTLVVGYNRRAEGDDALALGGDLARWTGARLVVCAVLPIQRRAIGTEGYAAALAEESGPLHARAAMALEGQPFEARPVGGGSPAHALHDLAEVEGADVLVLGSSHRGPLGRVAPGSVAERLLHGAPCAIAVAPRGHATRERSDPRVIAVGYDASPESQRALEVATELAMRVRGTLRVVAVHTPIRATSMAGGPLAASAAGDVAALEWIRARLAEAVEALPAELRAKGSLIQGTPESALATEGKLGVDLLVIGSRGYGTLRRAWLGSVAAKLIRAAPCPVVVLPRGAEHPGTPERDGERTEGTDGG